MTSQKIFLHILKCGSDDFKIFNYIKKIVLLSCYFLKRWAETIPNTGFKKFTFTIKKIRSYHNLQTGVSAK